MQREKKKLIRWVKYRGLCVGTSFTVNGIGIVILGLFIITVDGIYRLKKGCCGKDTYDFHDWYCSVHFEDYEDEII